MAYKRSDLALSPSEFVSHKHLQPELSEDPVFHTYDTKCATEKSYLHPHDQISNSELNTSSLQFSTQHSMNFKKSFFLTSPKRSVPSTPFMLSTKLKELQGQSLNLKLQEKLRLLEGSASVERKSEKKHLEPMMEVHKGRYNSMYEPILESSLVMEGAEDIEVPHLRWCASCGAEVTTKAVYVNTNKTFWSAVGIFLTGGVFGCFLLPYMTNSCKGVRLVCHKCDRTLL